MDQADRGPPLPRPRLINPEAVQIRPWGDRKHLGAYWAERNAA